MLWGEKYSPEYVNNLYNNIKRNTRYNFDMVCMTDIAKENFNEDIALIKFLRNPYENGWWTKVDMFSNSLPLSGKIIFLDLDMAIVGNVDWMFEHALEENDVMLLPDVFPENLYNSSFVKFSFGKHEYILDELRNFNCATKPKSYEELRTSKEKYWGDQIWISEHITNPERGNNIIEVPEGEIKSFKFELGGVNEYDGSKGASIVLFTGNPLPHEVYKQVPELYNAWVGDEVFEMNVIRNVETNKKDDELSKVRNITYWYVDDLNPNDIIGSVGRCGSGPNTVWTDWTPKGIRNRAAMESEYIEFMNELNGHYEKLSESVLNEGQLNPLILVRGVPFRRTGRHFSFREWTNNIVRGKKFVLEGVTGGSRLWALQKHEIPTKAIIIDRTQSRKPPTPNAVRMRTKAEMLERYVDDVKLKIDRNGNVTEEFGTLEHHHLTNQEKEYNNVSEGKRLKYWRDLNRKYGYELKLNPLQLKLIREMEEGDAI